MDADVIVPAEGETLSQSEETLVELLVDTEHMAAAGNVVVPGGLVPPPHLHRGHVECFVVLDGAMTVLTGDVATVVEAEAVAVVPRGVGHAFSVTERVRFLDVHAPAAGFGSFLRALHAAPDESALADARRAWDQEPVGAGSAGGAPVVVRLGTGEPITDRPSRYVSLLADTHDLAIGFSSYGPGEQGPEPHVHRSHTDAFLVLEGSISFMLRGQRLQAPAGTLVVVPPEVVHSFRNDGDEDARFLNLHAPSCGFGDYLRGRNPGFDQHDPPADGGADPALVAVRTLRLP
jgi:mannose-6-phosphate isomerase-like protein (cupin superfamily)